MENIFNYAMGGIVDSLEVYIIFRYMMIFFEDAYVNDRLAYIAYAARLFISLALRFASVSPVISAGISYGSIFFVSLCYVTIMSKRLIVSAFIYMCSFSSEAVVAVIVGISGFDAFGNTEHISVFWNLIIEMIFWARAWNVGARRRGSRHAFLFFEPMPAIGNGMRRRLVGGEHAQVGRKPHAKFDTALRRRD